MICIQICSNREWVSLKEILKIKEYKVNTYPFGEYINYEFFDEKCVFYHSGATKTRSSAACQYAIDKWEPQIIMVLGTCGGVDEILKVLDVVIANKTVQYDCLDKMGNEHQAFYEPLTTIFDNTWINFNNFSAKVYEGIIATADQDVDYKTLQMLRKENVMCGDWESGAIAHICSLNKVNCCIVRGITDIPIENEVQSGINQGLDYETNTPIVMKKLIENVLPILFSSIVNKYN